MNTINTVGRNSIIWITGASSGIGAAVAKKVARGGSTVYVSARSADKLADLAKLGAAEGKIIPLPLDVTDRDACIKAVDRIEGETGRLDLALLNAGTFIPVRGKELGFEAFDRTMMINFEGVVNCLVPAVDLKKRAGGGHLAIVSSVAGYGGLPLSGAYGASKAALINMAESLKFDLDKINIKLQLVNPGFVDTPLTEKNEFPMPFLMPLEKAAERLVTKLQGDDFEITFPRRFTWQLKALNLLPYSLYFPAISKFTGAGRKK